MEAIRLKGKEGFGINPSKDWKEREREAGDREVANSSPLSAPVNDDFFDQEESSRSCVCPGKVVVSSKVLHISIASRQKYCACRFRWFFHLVSHRPESDCASGIFFSRSKTRILMCCFSWTPFSRETSDACTHEALFLYQEKN